MPIITGSDPAAIERAAQALLAGDLVAVPTETVYGLAARADDDRAVARLFELKNRPSDHPLMTTSSSPSASARSSASRARATVSSVFSPFESPRPL